MRSRHRSTRASGVVEVPSEATLGDYALDAWQVNVAHAVGDEVNPAHHRTAVEPVPTGLPPFDTGRVEKTLAHVGRFLPDLCQTGVWTL